MKTISLILLFIVISVSTRAQTPVSADTTVTDSGIQTLFSHPGKLGWWVSPDFQWTKLDDRDAYLLGLSAGIIVKHSFSIGLAGYGIINSNTLKYTGINDTAAVYLYGGYGGLKLEYRIQPLKLINVAFPLLIGGGGVTYSTWGADNWNQSNPHDPTYDDSYIWDSYFVFEPGVLVGVNLLKFMRLDTGVTYRFTSGIQMPKTDSGLMTGLNVGMSLKFGKF